MVQVFSELSKIIGEKIRQLKNDSLKIGGNKK